MLRIAGVLFIAVVAAKAQKFEVASIKPTAPLTDGMFRISTSGGPGTSDPGRINFAGVPLRTVVAYAFDMKDFQIEGPAWIDSERFDVAAKVPSGTTKEQARVMMQNLLVDRFRMTFHREKKEMAAYTLTVGKGGPKMKVSDPEPPKDTNTADAAPRAMPPAGAGGMKMGKDGFPDMPSAGRGGPMMIMMPGKAKLTCIACTIAQLVDRLGQQLDRPIVDETGLKEKYDFTLVFEPDMRGMPMMAGRGPMPGGGGGPDGPAPKGDEEPVQALVPAIQDQLGLKMETKKAPVDLVAIDHLEKAPTEN